MVVDWLSVPAGIKFPKFTDEDRTYVDKWSKKIEPLVSRDELRRPYYATKRNKSHHYDQSYLWDMQEGHIADDLKEVAKIWTLHGFGYHGFFKPSVAEVIFQIPPEIISQVEYFCVFGPQDGPEMSIGECKTYFNSCYQVAQTILYKKAN